MGAGILPVALYRGTLFILLGQERHNNLWCDFGGRPNKGEKPIDTAIREGAEELNGFLGSEEVLNKTVNRNMILSISYDKYTTYIYQTKYDKNLPIYFSNVNKFAELQLKDKIDNRHNGLFEKKQIKWYTIKELNDKKTKATLRIHYQELVKTIIKNERFIITTINKLKHIDDEDEVPPKE
jgi:8-oxo-dGTP pyrophosphatase MutT (NUDIX family)